MCSDKNCQSTRCYKKKSPIRPMCGDDKNCQSTQHMQPKEAASHMWSVRRSEMFQSSNKQHIYVTHPVVQRCVQDYRNFENLAS